MNLNDPDRKPFDLLGELAKFGRENNISINDPQTITGFLSSAGVALGRAISDPALLYGQRTEAMFEAMLVSLGRYSLLKGEDDGRVHPDGLYQAPDFRVVLEDGTQWLIEVKNAYVSDPDPSRQKRTFMTQTYREKLENYTTATGGILKLAVYWARWGVWTLVSPGSVVDEKGDVTLDLETGLRLNELGKLGDRTIGTRPPLKFLLEADMSTSGPLPPEDLFSFTISNVGFYCGEEELLDPIDRAIAWMFMQYGQWMEIGPEPIMQGDLVAGIEFRWEPGERLNKGFEIIGTLSQIFSRYYAERTLDNQEVVQLHAPLRPGWFGPLVSDDYQKRTLPLWIFHQHPAA